MISNFSISEKERIQMLRNRKKCIAGVDVTEQLTPGKEYNMLVKNVQDDSEVLTPEQQEHDHSAFAEVTVGVYINGNNKAPQENRFRFYTEKTDKYIQDFVHKVNPDAKDISEIIGFAFKGYITRNDVYSKEARKHFVYENLYAVESLGCQISDEGITDEDLEEKPVKKTMNFPKSYSASILDDDEEEKGESV